MASLSVTHVITCESLVEFEAAKARLDAYAVAGTLPQIATRDDSQQSLTITITFNTTAVV